MSIDASVQIGSVARFSQVAMVMKANPTSMAAAGNMKTTRRRFLQLGGEPLPGTPADFAKRIAEDTERRAKVVTAAGLKPE